MTTAEKDLSHRADVATRLLDSSDQLSFKPVREVDWDSPVDPLHQEPARSGARSTARPTGTR